MHIYLRGGKKNSSHSHDVLCKGNVLVGYWERKNGCLPRSVFTFHSSPLLPTFSIYSTSFFFCMCVCCCWGVHNWRAKTFMSDPWAAGRLARHPSITGSRVGSMRRSKIAPLFFSLSLFFSSPKSDDSFSFIQNAACNDNTTFFRSRSQFIRFRRHVRDLEKNKRKRWWRFGESLGLRLASQGERERVQGSVSQWRRLSL